MKRFSGFFLIAALVSTGCGDEPSGPGRPFLPQFGNAVGTSWLVKRPAPTARIAHGTALNGKLYVFGGTNAFGTYNPRLEIYDPATDSWTTGASMPTARDAPAVTTLDGRIYAVGGFSLDPAGANAVESYDPVSNTWRRHRPSPMPRYAAGAAGVNGKLYVFGGSSDLELDRYDPATDTWTRLAPAPHRHFGPAVGVINGLIYVAGGDLGGGRYNADVDVYNPATNSWTTKRSMPTARTFTAYGVSNGRLYVAGGVTTGYRNTGVTESYDPATDAWSTEPAMRTPRFEAAAGVINGVLYAAGGYNYAFGFSNANEALVLDRVDPPPPADVTPPTITFAGARDYTVDQTVLVTCTVADDQSGVATHTCGSPLAAGPAYSFPLGENTVWASATDKAGNSARKSATFTVRVSFAGLTALVSRFVTHAGVANALTAKLAAAEAAAARGNLNAQRGQLNAFINQVNAEAGGKVTASDAAVLAALARALMP